MTDFDFTGNEESMEGRLCSDDQAALEALIDAEFDSSRLAEPIRSRAIRVANVLGLLDIAPATQSAPATHDQRGVLIDLTLARVQRQRAVERGESGTGLSPQDDDAFEALVGAAMAPDRVASTLRRRALHQASLLALLEPAAADLPDRRSVISRALARVQQAIQSQERRLRVEASPARGFRVRMGDLMTVAALLLIATAAIGPIVGVAREQARQSACAAGLAGAGQGFSAYASDFLDSLPIATASLAGNRWWDVGNPERSNSANEYLPIRTGHTTLENMACVGNPHALRGEAPAGAVDWRSLDEVSYSYQNMFSRVRPKWTSPTTFVVIVDASPVVRKAIRGERINPLANSMNHGGRGQNALFNDGSVRWLPSPLLEGGDNVYLPRPIEQWLARQGQPTRADPIKGTETPGGADDVFVGP